MTADQRICKHQRTHLNVDPEAIHEGPCIEVCLDCGMSRRHWEQGESPWINTVKDSTATKGSAYDLPINTEIVIGKRRWKLVHRMNSHPDIMRFTETTEGESDPMQRGFYPSEIQALMDAGFGPSPADEQATSKGIA